MAIFDPAFKRTLGFEGDYSDDAGDPGGKTRFGITEAVARAHGYKGEMSQLPLDTARSIYKADYWDSMKLDQVHDQDIAEELFDTGVNCGPGTAAKFCQRALNLLNKNGTLYPDLKVDGHFGQASVDAVNKVVTLAGSPSGDYVKVLLKVLNALQIAFYAEISEKNPKLEKFFLGWCKLRA